MHYTGVYQSPLGEMYLASDDMGLCGVWFQGQKYFASGMDMERQEKETEHIACARRWLDAYFAGQEPDFLPTFHLTGTVFQMAVWAELLKIPYGQTTTYGAIAREIAQKRGIPRMSAQAVGGAVGHNPVSVIIPCHRVVGTNGSLTGYAGGIDLKVKLLTLEGCDTTRFFVPRKGTTL